MNTRRYEETPRKPTIKELANEWWDNLCEADREEILQRTIIAEYQKRGK